MLAADAVDQLRGWLDAGLAGLRLFTTGTTMPGQADWLDDERSFPVWEYCQANDVTICLQMTAAGIPALTRMLGLFPRIRVLLDHLARPELAGGPPYEGAAALFGLAAFPGVYLKLTNRTIHAAADGASTPEAFFPRVVEAFGAAHRLGLEFPGRRRQPAGPAGGGAGRAGDPVRRRPPVDLRRHRAHHLSGAGRMNAPLILRTALKSYPHTAGLNSGEITDPRVSLECLDIDPIYRAFAPMAQRQEYDVSEMAIVTYLQAKAYGKPLVLLPTVVAARLQQGCIVYNANRGPMTVADLPGARVGVRAYTQTTGMWVRGILAETYGVPLEQVDWVAFEPSHLLEYTDPPFVTRAAADQKMLACCSPANSMRRFSATTCRPGRHRAADSRRGAGRPAWYEQHRFVPPNHVLVMRRDVAEQHPEAVRAVYDMFKRGKAGGAADRPAESPADRNRGDARAARRSPSISAISSSCCHVGWSSKKSLPTVSNFWETRAIRSRPTCKAT